jgi:O-antigen ligase
MTTLHPPSVLVTVYQGRLNGPTRRPRTAVEPKTIVRYAFYTFLFSVPFEGIDIGGTGNLGVAKLVGYFFFLVALLQIGISFKRPHKALWYFVIYLCVFILLGILQPPANHAVIVSRFVQLVQMLALMWIGSNLFRYERVNKGGLISLAAAGTIMAMLHFVGLIGTETSWGNYERAGGLGMDSNSFGSILALCLISFFGLVYGRNLARKSLVWVLVPASAIIGVSILRSGSRTAILVLVVMLCIFGLKGKSLATKVKTGLVVSAALVLLIVAVMQNEAFRARWERTFKEGSGAGREKIYPAAWRMFMDRPWMGWGPETHLYVLARRLHLNMPKRDTHNRYLWILTEVGLLGGIPFFVGLWLCYRSAWRGRNGPQGILPLVLLIGVLTVNLTLTWHNRKMHWVILAYSLANTVVVPSPRVRHNFFYRNHLQA